MTGAMDALGAAIAPRRRRGVELLDDPGADDALATRSLRDVAIANRLFGGTSAVLGALRPLLRRSAGQRLTLLDVGTGAGDIPERARALAVRLGVELSTVGLERTEAVAIAARRRTTHAIIGDAVAIPLADRSVDIVTCSQVLHHFEDAQAVAVLRELHRVARRLVIIADLRRSWAAATGIWAASVVLGFHPVSRHDGRLSVLRGYRGAELGALVHRAVGIAPRVANPRGFRVTASWSPA
jgi:SAM-dependent methyltransferase